MFISRNPAGAPGRVAEPDVAVVAVVIPSPSSPLDTVGVAPASTAAAAVTLLVVPKDGLPPLVLAKICKFENLLKLEVTVTPA